MSVTSQSGGHSSSEQPRHKINLDIYQLSEDDSWRPHRDMSSRSSNLKGANLTVSRLHGLIVKKGLYCMRALRSMTVQTTVPLCIMWIVMSLPEKETLHLKQLKLTNASLDNMTVVYAVIGNDETPACKVAEAYKDIGQASGWSPVRLSPVKLYGSLASINLMLTNTYVKENAIFMGAIFERSTQALKLNVTTLYNLQAYHSQPMAVAAALSALHRYCVLWNASSALRDMDAVEELDLAVQPLPWNAGMVAHQCPKIFHKFCIHSSIAVLTSITFLTSMFSATLIKERTVGSKHLQYLGGTNPLTYYLSNLLLDAVIYTLECAIIFTCLIYFSNFAYIFQRSCAAALISYGVTSLPLVYAAQTLFRNPHACLLFLLAVRVTLGVLLLFPLEIGFQSNTDVAWALKEDFRSSLGTFIPAYRLISRCYTLCINFQCKSYLPPNYLLRNSTEPPNREETSSRDIIPPVMSFICWTTIFIFLDSEILLCLRNRMRNCIDALKPGHSLVGNKDSNEEARKNNIRFERILFKECIELRKVSVYRRKKIIIGDISIAISHGERFCILGTSKTGQCTLMKVITGQEYATRGHVLHDMHELWSTFGKGTMGMSFCPQTDALMGELTGNDTLTFYGRLRGVPAKLLKTVTQTMMTALQVSDPDKLCAAYSATDKKKLSIAIALVGEPRIVVLDEPTLGLDYSDKMIVWRLLAGDGARKRTLIVSTSNAEECDILCTKMSIMLEGKLIYMTSPSSICIDNGLGYTAILLFDTDDRGHSPTQLLYFTFVVESFINVRIISDYGFSCLHFPNEDVNLAKLFSIMEDGVKYFHVKNYSIQKTSLRHILYASSIFPQVEDMDLSPLGPSPFDSWPPKPSSRHLLGTPIN